MSAKIRRTGAVSVPRYFINELLEISSSLKGEEAIEEIIRFIDFPDDRESGMMALKAVVRFYSNVRFLTEEIRCLTDFNRTGKI